MDRSENVSIVEACENLYDHLRRVVGVTTFRIELDRPTGRLVISLQRVHTPLPDPRYEWMRKGTAHLRLPLSHGGRTFGNIEIEDERRGTYSERAGADFERIVGDHAAHLCWLIRRAA